MSSFFCHDCAIKLGVVNPINTGNLTGTFYQQKKFDKHAVPPSGSSQTFVSVFDPADFATYHGYIASAIASGAVEVDALGRKSFAYTPNDLVGATYSSGYQRVDSAVRVVCIDDPQKLHAYPTASEQIVNGVCANCGGSLTP